MEKENSFLKFIFNEGMCLIFKNKCNLNGDCENCVPLNEIIDKINSALK